MRHHCVTIVFLFLSFNSSTFSSSPLPAPRSHRSPTLPSMIYQPSRTSSWSRRDKSSGDLVLQIRGGAVMEDEDLPDGGSRVMEAHTSWLIPDVSASIRVVILFTHLVLQTPLNYFAPSGVPLLSLHSFSQCGCTFLSLKMKMLMDSQSFCYSAILSSSCIVSLSFSSVPTESVERQLLPQQRKH